MELIIEIGTNSTKTVIVNDFHYYDERVNSGRIGEGLFETKHLSERAIEGNISILREIFDYYQDSTILNPSNFGGICNKEVIEVSIIATQALRTAVNCDVFCDRVMEEFGVKIHVLTSEEEAICAFKSQYPRVNDVVLDIGGGSTEIVSLSKNGDIVCDSYPIGVVYLKDLCSREIGVFDSAKGFYLYIEGVLKECMAIRTSPLQKSLTGIGGTSVALGMIKKSLDRFIADKIEGTEMSIDEIREIWDVLYSGVSDKYSIALIQEILKDRADVIIYGVGILLYVMKQFGMNKVSVSCRGVRHGYKYYLNQSI